MDGLEHEDKTPRTVNQIALEDYSELELAHDRKSGNTDTSRPGTLPFLAAVELDLERIKPLGLKKLFLAWFERGNKYWLNPMDKSYGLGLLEEILFKFHGDVQVLCPFVTLLTKLARSGISPRSFAEYVVLPRMRDDNNWRKWQDNHLEPLRIIADLITNTKDHPPFNREHLGSGRTHLARDIVLVRYIGRPLALFHPAQLRDSVMLEKYREAWQKTSLLDSLSLYFMRNNALHFIYCMSGKIDLVQLISIVEQLPDIECSFANAFPDGNIKLKKIQDINLYDYDIDLAIQERKRNGFHSLDFAVEIRAYFGIVRALLEKSTGLHLLGWYVRLLKRHKNPVVAEALFNLISVLDDRGGMHIYKWHTKKMLEKSKDAAPENGMQAYVRLVEDKNGCDPDYPKLHLLFRDEEISRETQDVFELANDLGLGNYITEKNISNASYRDLLNAYTLKFPDTGELIASYQGQVLSGLDRGWTLEYAQKLDELSSNGKSLFGLLLRSVIRGIGAGWMFVAKSSSFAGLFKLYGSVQSQTEISARTPFLMRVKPVKSIPTDLDALARKQVNLALLEKVWNYLSDAGPVNLDNTLVFVNKWVIELNDPLDKAFGNKVSIEETLRAAEDALARKKLEHDISKLDKTIKTLQGKRQHYTDVIDEFESLNNDQKFIAALVLAGAAAGEDGQFSGFVVALLLQRYRHLEEIGSRLDFLEDDISVEVLTYQQFLYLLNLLETLFFVLRGDAGIASLLKKDTVLQELLGPFAVTKKKVITVDALDAAAKKTTCYAALQSERAKWQGIIEEPDKKSNKYYHGMEIYVSKSFIDAHYGDMGGICLSSKPGQILRPGFYVQRLADLKDGQIVGMSLLYLSTRGFSSIHVQAQNYWHAFGFNPLHSVLSHCTSDQQLFLYLQFRLNMEKVAWATKMPVVLSGIETGSGLISNNGSFGDLIRDFELSKKTAKKVNNARGLSLYYHEGEYAKALVIIDPRGYEQVADPAKVPTFYAHAALPQYV